MKPGQYIRTLVIQLMDRTLEYDSGQRPIYKNEIVLLLDAIDKTANYIEMNNYNEIFKKNCLWMLKILKFKLMDKIIYTPRQNIFRQNTPNSITIIGPKGSIKPTSDIQECSSARSNPDKCTKKCGRNKQGGSACCVMCYNSNGFEGKHDPACTQNLGPRYIAYAQIAQDRLKEDSAFPAAEYYKLKYNGPLPTSLHQVFRRGWDTLVKAARYYAGGKNIIIVTGLWGTGVYNNPGHVVMNSFFNIAGLYSNISFLFCYLGSQKEIAIIKPFMKKQTQRIRIIKANMSKIASDRADQFPNSRVFLHNFANGSYAGGGAANGRTAQEEGLCREVTGLFKSLLLVNAKGFHLLGETVRDAKCSYTNALVTPNCNLAENPTGNKFTVISMAAPNQSPSSHGDSAWRRVGHYSS